MNLYNVLNTTATNYPDKIAIICGEHHISYSELHARTDQLAGTLQEQGLRKGRKAAILSPNSIEYVEIIFAILKLGAVCVPLNVRLSTQEIETIIRHSDAELLFYDTELAPLIPRDMAQLKQHIAIGAADHDSDYIYASLFTHSTKNKSPEPLAQNDLSCILYTAGTTGSPKGVMLTHGSHLSNADNYTQGLKMHAANIELAPTPLFHASTFGRLFAYVMNAMTFVLCRSFDAAACLSIIEHEKVTAITQAPSMYHLMQTALAQHPGDTSSITRAVTGAAPMRASEKQQIQTLFPRAKWYDLYGLTEASPGVSLLGPDAFVSRAGSVGRPLPGVTVQVCDKKRNEAAAGEVGEIVCSGQNIMAGYYKDPEATARVLQDGRLSTGDMGRVDAEGYLYITGRKKEIIISGGINIFPGEIEEVLREHPQVHDTAVFGVPDRTWGEKIIAAVVLATPGSVNEQGLVTLCRDRLAGFKCPKKFIFLDELPRNAAQKIMREKLRKEYKQ